jgi:hypothetical protein
MKSDTRMLFRGNLDVDTAVAHATGGNDVAITPEINKTRKITGTYATYAISPDRIAWALSDVVMRFDSHSLDQTKLGREELWHAGNLVPALADDNLRSNAFVIVGSTVSSVRVTNYLKDLLNDVRRKGIFAGQGADGKPAFDRITYPEEDNSKRLHLSFETDSEDPIITGAYPTYRSEPDGVRYAVSELVVKSNGARKRYRETRAWRSGLLRRGEMVPAIKYNTMRNQIIVAVGPTVSWENLQQSLKTLLDNIAVQGVFIGRAWQSDVFERLDGSQVRRLSDF